eukprot:m.320182 g.320182  ORF g.320182 m.320182 type:complete len:291 (-) comp27588_c1_seq32:3766-4638(-)
MTTAQRLTFEETWRQLQPIIRNILDGTPQTRTKDSHENGRAYTLVFDFASQGNDSRTENRKGLQLYDGLVMELRKWCSHIYCWHIQHAGKSMVAYVRVAEHYDRAANQLHRIFAYLQRHWLPQMRYEGGNQYVGIYTAALGVWRDVVLRRCIGRLVAPIHPTPQNGAAMFESVLTLFNNGEEDSEGDGRKRKRCDTLDALHGELDARIVRYKPVPCSWFDPEGPPTRVEFRQCYTDTRAAVLTLLLIGHRRANSASEAAEGDLQVHHSVVLATQFNAVHVWILIASFLPL